MANVVVRWLLWLAELVLRLLVVRTGLAALALWIARATGRTLLYALYFATVFGCAVCLYVAFYLAYIPTASLVRPVHLQFQSSSSESLVASVLSDSAIIDASALALRLDAAAAPPRDHITLTENYRLLSRSQGYDVSVVLDLPDSDVNRQLGMFMIGVSFLSAEGVSVRNASRPCVLRYRSDLLRTMHTLVFAIPLLLGITDQHQSMSVPIFEQMHDNPHHPITSVVVSVSKPLLQVYSATLRIDAHFIGLRYWMYWWPFTTGSILICWLFVLLLVLFWLVRRRYNVDAHFAELLGWGVDEDERAQHAGFRDREAWSRNESARQAPPVLNEPAFWPPPPPPPHGDDDEQMESLEQDLLSSLEEAGVLAPELDADLGAAPAPPKPQAAASPSSAFPGPANSRRAGAGPSLNERALPAPSLAAQADEGLVEPAPLGADEQPPVLRQRRHHLREAGEGVDRHTADEALDGEDLRDDSD
ncbi:hypothetical protein CAOG_009617 [Capsaspora owczarzaki ATCC 30864]|uniref:Seipin n=1 Tax=Capsaspora owczarzaki (strain ATCC 30864) TaxID=595528 RepID=A0A0D2X255_CAPO3|nr:hypothetical protein CAOG_009617 [Capsaspora owczarzaki ATCC 30864]